MILSLLSAGFVCAGIPRESGDDPVVGAVRLYPDWYSPRERG